MGDVLYIAAKAPRSGMAKTRLGQDIGAEGATELYRAFLRDMARRFAHAPFPVGWYVTPRGAWAEIEPLTGPTTRAPHVLYQGPGDWTERQRQLFRGAAARGEARVILVASDSPHLEVAVVSAAFQLLRKHDLVVGPVADGGYYLLGMRGWHDVLRGVPMSTSTVLQELLEHARQLGLAVGQVEPTFDVDDARDLPALRALVLSRPDLPATRAALERLGLLDVGALPHPAATVAG